MQYYSLQHWTHFPNQTHPQLGLVSTLAQPLHPSGAISLLFSGSILDTCRPGGSIFQCHIFLPFHAAHGALKARTIKRVNTPFSGGTLSSMTCLSWVALHSMAHSFTELGKAVVHMISLVSFL